MAKFENDMGYMPVTMAQFEALTNEILAEFNKIADPHFLSGDYMAQILMGALHAYDKKIGWVSKSEIFDSCVNRVSSHVTFHAVEEIRKRLAPAQKPQLVESEDDFSNEPPAAQ